MYPKCRAVALREVQKLPEELYYAGRFIQLTCGCPIAPALETTQQDESLNKQKEGPHLQ